jgi:xylobiose transport system permease protein
VSTTITRPPASGHRPGSARRGRPGRLARGRFNLVGGLSATVWFVIVSVPLYFLLTTSLRTSSEYLLAGPLTIPKNLSFANYRLVADSNFGVYFWNTLLGGWCSTGVYGPW